MYRTAYYSKNGKLLFCAVLNNRKAVKCTKQQKLTVQNSILQQKWKTAVLCSIQLFCPPGNFPMRC